LIHTLTLCFLIHSDGGGELLLDFWLEGAELLVRFGH
jgi:hypothetical protein